MCVYCFGNGTDSSLLLLINCELQSLLVHLFVRCIRRRLNIDLNTNRRDAVNLFRLRFIGLVVAILLTFFHRVDYCHLNDTA